MGTDVMTAWGLVLEVGADATRDAREAPAAVFARARAAFLDRCPRLAELLRAEDAKLRVVREQVEPMPAASAGADARVGVSVVEVRPSSFDMAIRIRPLGDGLGPPSHGRCTIEVARRSTGERVPIPRDLRDEFIAWQVAARDLC